MGPGLNGSFGPFVALPDGRDCSRGAHVWGPAPEEGLGSVSVIGPTLGVADALATALFASGATGTHAWFGQFEGYCAVLAHDDGSLSRLGPLPAGVSIIV